MTDGSDVRSDTTRAHLVICAFWTTEDCDIATKRVSSALKGMVIEGSGATVSIKQVDGRLRQWLRAVQIEEAADYEGGSS